MSWIPVKTIVGPPAEGEKFLKREYIANEFWEAIQNGQHVIFTAPRRVGKSSVMKDLEQNPRVGYEVIYNNIESDKTSMDFYRRIFKLLLEEIGGRKKFIKSCQAWVKQRGIGELGTQGVKIERHDLDYKAEMLGLLEHMGGIESQVVLMLDEFPDVLHSIEKQEGADAAMDVLHTLRTLRHEKKFGKVRFVFAGSVGLDHVVKRLGRSTTINDLQRITVGELSKGEANELIRMITLGASMKLPEQVLDYILKAVSHLLPYYLQLVMKACDTRLHRDNRQELTAEDVDQVLDELVRKNEHFDDWDKRLKTYLSAEDWEYCQAILQLAAHAQAPVRVQELMNLSHSHKGISHWKDLLDDVLVRDGYLIESKDEYTFLSPLLRRWWARRYPDA